MGFFITLAIMVALMILGNFAEHKYWINSESSWWVRAGFSSLNAVLLGLGLGITGFLMGASIGDESAGEAAVYFFFIGLGVGAVIGFAVSMVWNFFI